MQKPDTTCQQGRETNPHPAELASQPGSLHCSSESVSPLSHKGRCKALSCAPKALSYGENIVKFGPVYPQILD